MMRDGRQGWTSCMDSRPKSWKRYLKRGDGKTLVTSVQI